MSFFPGKTLIAKKSFPLIGNDDNIITIRKHSILIVLDFYFDISSDKFCVLFLTEMDLCYDRFFTMHHNDAERIFDSCVKEI